MAILQVAALSIGTFLSVLLHFAELPLLISELKRNEPMKNKYQVLLGSHFAHLLWIVYSIQIWDSDFAIPNLILAVLTFGYLYLIHVMSKSQAGATMRYFLLIPILFVVLWRSSPAILTGVGAALAQLIDCKFALENCVEISKSRGVRSKDLIKIEISTVKYGLWLGLGVLKADYCILSAFAAGLAINVAELILTLVYPPLVQEEGKKQA